jgi:hypothetical protein
MIEERMESYRNLCEMMKEVFEEEDRKIILAIINIVPNGDVRCS